MMLALFTEETILKSKRETILKSKVVTRMFKVHEAHWRVRTAYTLLILSVASAIASEAQTYNVLTRLVPGDGLMPKSLVQGPMGTSTESVQKAGITVAAAFSKSVPPVA